MRLDQLEQLGVDRRPDRAARRLAAADERVEVGRRASRPGSTIDSTGTWISRSSSLRTPVSTIRHVRVGPTRKRAISSSGFWVADSPIRWTSRPAAARQPLERQRQMRAALGRGDRVDLVDDAPLGAGEQLLRAAGQHQVQRLGRRDQDVRRLAQHRLALALGRVAGPHRHLQVGADPAQRHAQVAVDVVGERLQRRDVDEPDVLAAPASRSSRQPVDRPQERGQRLARPGGRRDQDVLARGDRRPRLGLRRRRLGERACEPLARARS